MNSETNSEMGSEDNYSYEENYEDIENDIKSNSNYTILNSTKIQIEMKKIIYELSSILDLSEDLSEFILNFYNWNKFLIVEKYYQNPKKLKDEIGLINDKVILSNKCRICYSDFNNDSFCVDCNHKFCKDCYAMYLKTLLTESNCIVAHCPEIKCKYPVTRSIFNSLVFSSEIKSKYQVTHSTFNSLVFSSEELYNKYSIEKFIRSCKKYVYCPGENCQNIIFSEKPVMAICDCNLEFCTGCQQENHLPASCELIEKWNLKNNSESENISWIKINTKKCPSCNVSIEKNDGCNHMTCKSCKHEFCWLCFKNWKNHMSCTKFENNDVDYLTAKYELEKYTHYFNLFINHNRSIKIAEKQKIEIVNKFDNHQNLDTILKSFDAIINTRKLLKNSYIIGFYMDKDSPEKQLFEFHQEMLDKNIDKLHGLIENKNFTKINFVEINNLNRIVENVCKSLMEVFQDIEY